MNRAEEVGAVLVLVTVLLCALGQVWVAVGVSVLAGACLALGYLGR